MNLLIEKKLYLKLSLKAYLQFVVYYNFLNALKTKIVSIKTKRYTRLLILVIFKIHSCWCLFIVRKLILWLKHQFCYLFSGQKQWGIFLMSNVYLDGVKVDTKELLQTEDKKSYFGNITFDWRQQWLLWKNYRICGTIVLN